VLLSLVVGEEETGDGTEALLEAYRFTDALVAEPTGLQPCTSHYGYMELILTLSGYRRHAAMSDKSSNAIRAMLRLLLQLEDKIDAYERDTVLNIRDLHSSESGFAVPDSCSAAADLHLPADVDVKRYAEDLRRFLTSILDDSQVNDFSIEMPFIANGYSIDSGDLLVRSLASVYADSALPWKPGAFKSHSDANLLRDAGCAPVILGPGMLSAAHTRDEHAPYSQVLQAAEIYIKLLRTLSAS
jgi:acetylornithine deacetylase